MQASAESTLGTVRDAGSRHEDGHRPYLSLVVAARNDDHGGNLRTRMQIFLDAWINQAKRHQLDSELIVVEWNPPPDRPKLRDAMRWPENTAPCRVRIIEVPSEIHARYRHGDGLPLYQMVAKNVGMRHARGEFVLCANIDLIFSDELMRFLASRKLEKGILYRIDRHDVMEDVPVDATLDQQLSYCQSHLIRVWTRSGAFPLTPDGSRQIDPEDIVAPESGIVLGQGWFPIERYVPGERFRWIEDEAQIAARIPPEGAILRLEVEPGPGVADLPASLQVLDENGSVVAGWQVGGRAILELTIPGNGRETLRHIHLRVSGGGRPVAHDLRILNFRVFECAWVERRAAENVSDTPMPPLRANFLVRYRAAQLWKKRGAGVFEDSAYRTGQGWNSILSGEAQLAVPVTHPKFKLALLVIADSDATLVIRSEDGAVLARKRVNGVTYVEAPVRSPAGSMPTLILSVEGGAVNVLACGSRHSNRGQIVPRAWNALTIATEPRKSEWSASPDIAGMDQPAFLHTQACGDFTMMAKEHWLNVRGYAELDMYSLHLDSLFCYAALHAGAREMILRDPMRLYHIEHSSGSGFTPGQGGNQLSARLAKSLVPLMSNEEAVWMVSQMRKFHAPMIMNPDGWGLDGLALSETQPVPCLENLR